MAIDLKQIDPSLDLMKDFSKITKGTTQQIQKMRQEAIFTDGKVSAKHKSLAAMLWSVSARCEPCIRFYVQQAVKHGATEEEMGEFLAIGSAMGGCVGEMWSLKAYKAYSDGLQQAECSPGDLSCCH